VEFDRERSVSTLQALVRFQTVSNRNCEEEAEEEFEALIQALFKLYPNVCKAETFTRVGRRAVLIHWKGKSSDAPTILTAHFDVVPVDEQYWEKPPFAGVLEDGVLWGRGTLDTKITLNAALSAAETLIQEGFVPEQDVYFGFSGNEEIYGDGADCIIDFLTQRGVRPAMVLDEGGAVVEGVFPGVTKPCGLIGIAEKGLMDVEFSCVSNGGHASAPKPHTSVGILSRACCNMENHPFAFHISKPVAEMFDTLGRHSTFFYRMIFANLWCFSWILDLLCKKQGGDLNALMRTTVAFTQMSGSKASNVIPTHASMVANLRLNPMDSCASAKQYIEQTVQDSQVEICVKTATEPSNISPTDGKAYEKIQRAVASTWRDAIVAPYLMVQCSDSRRYERICKHVYRFSAMDLTAEERSCIHGNNERIRVETIHHSVEFYIRLIRNC
jgi:carboxypeptidase PM20D1